MDRVVHNVPVMDELEPIKPKNKGQFRPGEGGRPKGIPNKLPREAKAAIAEAAERLGGVNRLVSWAQEDKKNESAFWVSVYPKLLPLTVHGNAKITVEQIVRKIVDPKCDP